MRRLELFVAMFLFSTSVYASDIFRFGARIVEVGDTAAKLIEVGGAPVLREPIEDKEGGLKGERWQYARDDFTITFVIKDGKISSIEQTHN
jgi:hypothetical protein